jgi:hypothetical protein
MRPSEALVRLPGTSSTPSAERGPTNRHGLHPTLLVRKDWTIGNDSFGAAIIDFVKNAALRCSCERQLISVKKPALRLPTCSQTAARIDLSEFPLYDLYGLCRICKNSWVQPAIFNQCVAVDINQALPRVCDLLFNKNVQRCDAEHR